MLNSVEFLDRRDHRLEDVYRGGKLDATAPRRRPDDCAAPADPTLEARTLKALGRLTHMDDPERVAFYREQIRREQTAARA